MGVVKIVAVHQKTLGILGVHVIIMNLKWLENNKVKLGRKNN